jgi:hypothetical protein
MLIWEGDEIKCRSPNFVTLRKNYILRLQHCRREKWSWTIARHILYRFQYRKFIWGHLKKVWRKKIFSLKSMTKLEDLTVCRVQSSVWRLPKYWPPTPFPASACVLPLHQRRGGGVNTRRAVRGWGVNILKDARHRIGLFQYNLSTVET